MFAEQVYEIVRKIPEERISTYKEIARIVGCRAYRAVGSALNKNPYRDVPCWRIVNSNGFVGEFVRGKEKKIELLEREGIIIKDDKVVNFEKLFYSPSNSTK